MQQQSLLLQRKNKVNNLTNLTNQQVEKALAYLANPEPEPLPQELQHLQEAEWAVLQMLLSRLEWERNHLTLH